MILCPISTKKRLTSQVKAINRVMHLISDLHNNSGFREHSVQRNIHSVMEHLAGASEHDRIFSTAG